MNLHVSAPHLFLDLDGIATSSNLTVELGSLLKDYDRPVVSAEEPWEAFMAAYSSLLLTAVGGAPAYHLYYCCASLPPNYTGNYVCLATSADGLSWVKPNLTAFPWVDGRPTNRVFAQTGGGFMGNVFEDNAPGVPAAERLKLLYSADDPSGNYGGVYLAASADGLFFKAVASPSVPLPVHYGDTQPAMVWDAARTRHAVFGRNDSPSPNTTQGCKGAGGATRRVLSAFSTSGAGGGFANATLLLQYGPPDQPDCLDVYNSSPLPLDDDSGPGGAFLFFPSSYRHFPTAGSLHNLNNDGVLDVRLAVSRDGGLTAAFASRDALIPRGMGALAAPGTFTAAGSDPDAGAVYATAGGLVDPDKLAPPPAPQGRPGQGLLPYAVPSPRVSFLFYGTQRTHQAIWTPGQPPTPGFNGILRASLRREGFAGLRTPAGDPVGAGALTTVPLLVPQPAAACGNASAQLWLLLNVQTSVAGGAAVALLTPGSLAPLPGRGPQDALPFVGDHVRAPVGWAPGGAGGDPVRDLSPYAGSQVVLSVRLVHAHLFAWELQCV
jgi:hypothetical protein